MKNIKIVILVLIAIIVTSILVISTNKRDESRSIQVEDFEKFYLPKKTRECLIEHGYSVENPSAEEKKECDDYVKQIWDEQRVLNNIEG